MSIWLDPTGKSTYGIAICSRCSRKMSLDDLYDDPNAPGLKVCLADRDHLDPWRLPARQPENIALRFSRPDVPLVSDPFGLPTEDDDYFLITEDGEEFILP